MLKLQTDSGVIVIPTRLAQDLLSTPLVLSLDEASHLLDGMALTANAGDDRIHWLQAARRFYECDLRAETALALTHFARARGLAPTNGEQGWLTRWYLATSTQILCQLVPILGARQDVSPLITELRETFGDYLHALSRMPSIEALAHEASQITDTILDYKSFATPVETRLLTDLVGALEILSGEITFLLAVRSRLSELRRQIVSAPRPSREQRRLLELLDPWDSVLSAAIGEQGPAESPLDEDELEAHRSIKALERALRVLIERHYHDLFGPQWLQHIQDRSPKMAEAWEFARSKDQHAFRIYADYTPSILEYAHFGDLTELIISQWQAFRTALDFGLERANKARFVEMMQAIAKVRNPIAHHRAIPHTELLRARVYCDDILNALGAPPKTD